MAALRLLMLELFVHIVYSQVYSSKDGVTIKTVFSVKNVCKSNERKFASLLGLSIEECVQECGLRSHCVALNFQRRTKVCELLYADGKDVLHTAGCIHVRASDIEVIQKPCTDCAYGEVCDIITRQCIFKECLATVTNGLMLGNVFSIGAVTRYKCDDGYTDTSGVINATCLPLGQWSAAANCQIACGDPPSILNGNTELDTANSYSFMDTATVSCNTGYIRSADKISCIESGSWETATCDPIYVFLKSVGVQDCYTGSSWEYTGKKNVTESGAQCQRWDSQTPRKHSYTNIDDYPDSSFSEANNYCRNPDSSFYELWCYTVDVSKPRWELCGIPEC